jgi:hypothetical protein
MPQAAPIILHEMQISETQRHTKSLNFVSILYTFSFINFMKFTTFDTGSKLSYFLMIYSSATNGIRLKAKNTNRRCNLESNFVIETQF